METGTTGVGIFAILKWLFPSILGSILAVWYKRHDVDWESISTSKKVIACFVGVGAIVLGTAIAHIIGGAIISQFQMDNKYFQMLVYLVCGLSGLKVLDAIVKNIDPVLEIIMNGFKELVTTIVETVVNKWRK